MWAAIAGAVIGAVIGSFVAVVALRWPAGRPFVTGRSSCDGCGAPLSPIELVPLASFLALRGRCRRCGQPIDRLHVTAELAAALLGAAAFAAGRPEGALFGWALLLLALLDARHFWLPDRVTLPLAALGLALGLPPLADRVIGAVAGWLSLTAIAAAYRAAKGRVGMGAGDAKLMAAIGAWLGWRDLPLVLLLASVSGICWAVVRGMRRDARLPLGTLLALAAFPAWLAGALGFAGL